MRRYALAASMLLVFMPAVHAQSPSASPIDQPVIVAQGDVILMRAPDRAYVQLGADGRASKAKDAQRVAADAMTAVQAALKKLGIPDDAIKTTAYSLQQEMDYSGGKPTVKDYVAHNQIEVRLDDITRLAEVLDSVGNAGTTTVTNLRFELKNRNAVELEALGLAVKDATARAVAIAAGAGKMAGPVVRIQEQRTASASPTFQTQTATMSVAGGRGGGGGYSTPIEPGEIQVRAQVTLTVAIR